MPVLLVTQISESEAKATTFRSALMEGEYVQLPPLVGMPVIVEPSKFAMNMGVAGSTVRLERNGSLVKVGRVVVLDELVPQPTVMAAARASRTSSAIWNFFTYSPQDSFGRKAARDFADALT